MVCPAETPEGQACGLVKNLAMMAHISVGSQKAPILEFLEEWNTEALEDVSVKSLLDTTKIFVNGTWVGIHRQPQSLADTLKKLRRTGDIVAELSIVRDIRDRELRLYTDAGRICRPLFIVDRQRLVLKRTHLNELQEPAADGESKWNGLLRQGVVEYVDTEEEETIMICMTAEDLSSSAPATPKGQDPTTRHKITATAGDEMASLWTHCEIHPSMILGIAASIIPFPDHNQVCPVIISIFRTNNVIVPS